MTKKLSILLTLLLILTTVGCKTLPKCKIVLPPQPQREEIPEIKTVQDLADVINYYEHLVQEWETWGNNVNLLVGDGE